MYLAAPSDRRRLGTVPLVPVRGAIRLDAQRAESLSQPLGPGMLRLGSGSLGLGAGSFLVGAIRLLFGASGRRFGPPLRPAAIGCPSLSGYGSSGSM